MPYSTVALVQSEFRVLDVSATTSVTTDDINGFITETDALINAKVGVRYSTPVLVGTSPNSFAILQMISRKLVALRVRDILEVKNLTDTAAQQDVRGGLSKKDLMKMLDDIANGSLILDDSTVKNNGVTMSSFNSENSEEAYFKKNVDQW